MLQHHLCLLFLFVLGCGAPQGEFQLIETAPVETSIGSDDLPEFHEVWRELIEGARERLELAHFYASDETGSRLGPIVQALEAAAARGVRVRFLGEERFYETYPETLDRLAAVPGIEVRRIDLSQRTGGVQHAKYMLADGERLCLGSANFDWRSLEHIQELGVLVSSAPVALALGDVFEMDWALAAGESPPVAFRDPGAFPARVRTKAGEPLAVTPVFSPRGLLPHDARWDLPHLVAWIDGAREAIRIQLLTFRMSDRSGERFAELESALLRAAERGVRVHLLVADWGKRPGTIEGLKQLTQVPNVDVRLATLPPAARGHIPFARVIHSKYMVVDEELSWIGTSNWEKSYFHEGRNVGLLIEGQACAARLARYFDEGWSGPYAYDVDPDRDYVVPRIGD